MILFLVICLFGYAHMWVQVLGKPEAWDAPGAGVIGGWEPASVVVGIKSSMRGVPALHG